MSHSRHRDELYHRLLIDAFLLYKNDPAYAVNSRQTFPGITNITNENIDTFLDGLDNPSIILNNEKIKREADFTRLHERLLGYGLTEYELSQLKRRDQILFEACMFTVVKDNLTPLLFDKTRQAEKNLQDILEKSNKNITKESIEAEQVLKHVSKENMHEMQLFQEYLVEHFIRKIDILNTIYNIEKYLATENKSLAEKKIAQRYLDLIQSNKSPFYKRIIIHALLKREDCHDMTKSYFEMSGNLQMAIDARMQFAIKKSADLNLDILKNEYSAIIEAINNEKSSIADISKIISNLEKILPTENELRERYIFPANLNDKIKVINHSDITINDFLQFLARDTNCNIENVGYKNAHGKIRLLIKFIRQGREFDIDQLPMLRNFKLNKTNEGYYEFYPQISERDNQHEIKSKPHLFNAEITDNQGEIIPLKFQSELAWNMMEALKLILPKHHQGLKNIQATIHDISSGGWSENKWKEIEKECKFRISSLSITSHFRFFGISSSHSRDPEFDLLYRCIAELKENVNAYSSIKTLEETLLAQKKRDLILKFREGVNRFTPLISSIDEITQFKIFANETAIKKLQASNENEDIPELLIDTPVLDNNGNPRTITIEGRTYSTVAEAMNLKRGHFEAKSAKLWEAEITNYQSPISLLEKISNSSLRIS